MCLILAAEDSKCGVYCQGSKEEASSSSAVTSHENDSCNRYIVHHSDSGLLYNSEVILLVYLSVIR